MAIPHATPGQPVDVQPLGAALTGARTTALFKSRDLEVFRLVLGAGDGLPPHKVDGEITIQCLEGQLDIELEGATTRLAAGQLTYLQGGAVHAVTAPTATSALVTICLRG